MRTTVTFEPDVHARIRRLQAGREFKSFINDVLRHGLDAIESQAAKAKPAFELPLLDLKPRVLDLDNIQRILDELDEADGKLMPR